MLTTLKVLEIGTQGVVPRIVFMNTGADEAAVTTPGFINAAQGYSDAKIQPGDFIYGLLANNLQESFIPIFGANGVITLQSTGGVFPPPDFTYSNVWFVSADGNNAFPGTNMNQPMADFPTAIAAAEATDPIPGVRKIIIGLDGNSYTDDIAITQLNLDIHAPYAAIESCAIDLTAASGGIATNLTGNNLVFGRWHGVTYTDHSSTTPPTIYNTIQLTVSFVYTSDIVLGVRSCEMLFNVWDYNTNSITSTVNAGNIVTYYSFGINNALTSNDEDGLTNINLASWARVSGYVGAQSIETATRFVQSTSANLDPTWLNSTIYGTPTGNINYNISTAFDAACPVGWEALCIRSGGTGNIRLIADGGITIVTSPANPETAGDGGWFILRKIDVSTWFCGGDIQNTGSNSFFRRIAGTTQAAAAGNGYINDNASLTTITLPAVSNEGDVIAVQGSGAGGWSLVANTGQVIHVAGSPTSSGGSVSSANRYDAIEVVCIVANTSWGVKSSSTAGFTIA